MSTTSWPEARRIAAGAAIPLPLTRVPLARAAGMVLGESLSALVDLPPFATSAMDGWAVAGPGPWKVTGQVLAGQQSARIGDGEAVEIATGARVPSGAEAVLRRERGLVDEHHRLHVREAEDAQSQAAVPPARQRMYGSPPANVATRSGAVEKPVKESSESLTILMRGYFDAPAARSSRLYSTVSEGKFRAGTMKRSTRLCSGRLLMASTVARDIRR